MTNKHFRLASLVLLLATGLACAALPQVFDEQLADLPLPTIRASATRLADLGSTARRSIAPGSNDPQVIEQMETIEDQIIELRGLQPTGPVERELLPSDELRQVVEEDLLEDFTPEEAADDARLLALLGLIEPGFDLWELYHDLYAEQIAGFYDDDEEVMYVVQGAGFEGPERLTYAHEYVHALQDQNFDLDEGLGFNDEACEADSERCAGIQALIEGDASLVEEQWLRTYATETDIEQLLAFYDGFSSPVFDGAPTAIQESFIFPYREGLGFVRWLEREGGWAEVDQAFKNPPVSSEHVLHPIRYPKDQPTSLTYPEVDPESIGDDWRELDRGTLGEFDHQLMLARVLEEETAREAAAGWGGDVYVAFYNDDSEQGALILIQSWDTIRDAQDAYLSWRDYGDARFGERIPTGDAYRWEAAEGHARLERASDQTLWMVAPDSDVLAVLREAVAFPSPGR